MKTDGRQEEFIAMVHRVEGILVRICLLFSDRTPDGIHDLYQDILCEMWRSYPAFRHESTESTWTYRVALRTAMRHHRKERRSPVMVYMTEPRLDTLAIGAHADVVERLYGWIDLLPENDRQLAYLYVENLSTADIAAALGVNVNTVKQRIKHMKQRLKKIKEDEERR